MTSRYSYSVTQPENLLLVLSPNNPTKQQYQSRLSSGQTHEMTHEEKINRMLDVSNVIKICDFGWSVKQDFDLRNTFCGTAEYMAPEIVAHQEYDRTVDIWSLGVILYEMLHGHSPFKAARSSSIYDNILRGLYRIDESLSSEAQELIKTILQVDPRKRPTISSILNHKLLQKYDLRQVSDQAVTPQAQNTENSHLRNSINQKRNEQYPPLESKPSHKAADSQASLSRIPSSSILKAPSWYQPPFQPSVRDHSQESKTPYQAVPTVTDPLCSTNNQQENHFSGDRQASMNQPIQPSYNQHALKSFSLIGSSMQSEIRASPRGYSDPNQAKLSRDGTLEYSRSYNPIILEQNSQSHPFVGSMRSSGMSYQANYAQNLESSRVVIHSHREHSDPNNIWNGLNCSANSRPSSSNKVMDRHSTNSQTLVQPDGHDNLGSGNTMYPFQSVSVNLPSSQRIYPTQEASSGGAQLQYHLSRTPSTNLIGGSNLVEKPQPAEQQVCQPRTSDNSQGLSQRSVYSPLLGTHNSISRNKSNPPTNILVNLSRTALHKRVNSSSADLSKLVEVSPRSKCGDNPRQELDNILSRNEIKAPAQQQQQSGSTKGPTYYQPSNHTSRPAETSILKTLQEWSRTGTEGNLGEYHPLVSFTERSAIHRGSGLDASRGHSPSPSINIRVERPRDPSVPSYKDLTINIPDTSGTGYNQTFGSVLNSIKHAESAGGISRSFRPMLPPHGRNSSTTEYSVEMPAPSRQQTRIEFHGQVGVPSTSAATSVRNYVDLHNTSNPSISANNRSDLQHQLQTQMGRREHLSARQNPLMQSFGKWPQNTSDIQEGQRTSTKAVIPTHNILGEITNKVASNQSQKLRRNQSCFTVENCMPNTPYAPMCPSPQSYSHRGGVGAGMSLSTDKQADVKPDSSFNKGGAPESSSAGLKLRVQAQLCTNQQTGRTNILHTRLFDKHRTFSYNGASTNPLSVPTGLARGVQQAPKLDR